MSRVYLSVLAAGAVSLLSMQPAAAGCCNSWGGGWGNSWGWSAGWGNGCCGSSVVAVQPAVTFVQPAPVVVQPAPIIVQQPQVIVQQPQVIVQQQPVIQAYAVNQGPVYSGPGTDYSPAYYQPARAVDAYPYIGGYYGRPVYRARPYRAYRPYRPHYGVRKSYRWSGYHRSAPRYHRAPAAKYYHYK
jgi:hypothetical protein